MPHVFSVAIYHAQLRWLRQVCRRRPRVGRAAERYLQQNGSARCRERTGASGAARSARRRSRRQVLHVHAQAAQCAFSATRYNEFMRCRSTVNSAQPREGKRCRRSVGAARSAGVSS